MQDTWKYYKYLPVFEVTKKERKLLAMCYRLRAVEYLCHRITRAMQEMSFIQGRIYGSAARRLRLKIQEAIDYEVCLEHYIEQYLPSEKRRWFELECTCNTFCANLRTLWIQKLLEHNP